ncbi:hypothetical protein, conserved [Plasmodium vivax]|uniref:Leucine-rich repeat protein n=1 Tax=Plasmodium vivax (strain Salvador I) TaxID=126793 RepID=A5K8N6_PLAVS|nr:hypothetical protein, conserved [Plasmodium vivax]EDL44182.1 hypothetical protein, conserved [Plasmodium vivax]|eukprot:XP_001613909.1 hypothetical protein [Plasmodium vivax Sal-1]
MALEEDADRSLTTKYILMTERLKGNQLEGRKLKLKACAPGTKEPIDPIDPIDHDVIEQFCDALKRNTSFKGYLDISHNDLNETCLFHILCSVYESKNITGMNLRGNKITNMLFNKILLILESNNLEYINVQNTELNNQQIKNIIFCSLNRRLKFMKLSFLNLDTFQFLVEYLRDNDSVEKLHFFMSYGHQMNSSRTQDDENIANNFENYVHVRYRQARYCPYYMGHTHRGFLPPVVKKKSAFSLRHIRTVLLPPFLAPPQNLKNALKEFLDVIENKANVKEVRCEIDFHDQEVDEMVCFIHAACERHRRMEGDDQGLLENGMQITSSEKMLLLMPDIDGCG